MDRRYDSLVTVAADMRAGRVGIVELVSDHVERAASVGKSLNCLVTLTADSALELARKLEARARAGDLAGPLHGVPVTVKDNIAMAGAPTTAGSRALADWVPHMDATVVRRLRGAGAVIVGKTNLSELAFGSTNPEVGDAVNPWDPERSTGGSSSGSAVALAAGIGYGSIGTDTGGSIRIPSSMCGLVGLKPTHGLVELDGVVTISPELDHVGPMARTVEDVALILGVIAREGWSGRGRLAALSEGVQGLRLGTLRDEELEGAHPASLEALRGVVAALVTAGCDERAVDVPDMALARSTMWTLAAVDLLVDHEETLAAPGVGASLREAVDRAVEVSAADYVRARRARDRIAHEVDELFESVDLLLTPGVPVPAHPLSERAAMRQIRQAYTTTFNLSGHPALVVPAALSPEGLPLGVQIVGRRGMDDVVLRAGLAVERAVGPLWERQDVRRVVTASVDRLAASGPASRAPAR